MTTCATIVDRVEMCLLSAVNMQCKLSWVVAYVNWSHKVRVPIVPLFVIPSSVPHWTSSCCAILGFLFKVPDADFAIQNAGGCRTDIDKGSFSIADAYGILPFSNTLVTLDLTGKQIKEVLEDALENFLNETIAGSDGSFPNAAGLRWEADYTKSFGERIINLEMNSRLESNDWKPIVMDTNYLVVTNNFIAQGKDVSILYVFHLCNCNCNTHVLNSLSCNRVISRLPKQESTLTPLSIMLRASWTLLNP